MAVKCQLLVTTLPSMSDVLVSVLTSLGATGLAVYLARNWLAERLRQSIKHEYDEKLERLKAQLVVESGLNLERFKSDLSREASILTVAHRSLGVSVAMAQRRRVGGVSDLWKALLNVRNNSPEIFTFLDVLLPDEYATLEHHQFKTFEPDISAEALLKMVGDNAKTIETVRPFVGEYLWYLFYVYQAIHLRVAFLYTTGRAKANHTPWYEDAVSLKLLASVITQDEMASLKQLKVGQIKLMRQLIESKFLAAVDRIISGQAIGDFAAEEAARIARAVAEVAAEKGSNIDLQGG
jgi:hypothetical protein